MKNKLVLILSLLCLGSFIAAQINPNLGSQIYISVNVTGYVSNPGTYQMTPLNRVADALKMSGGTLPKTVIPEELDPQQAMQAVQDSLMENNQALRTVELIRGGQSTICDLMDFLRNGNLEQNPLLRDGDVIRVSPVSESVSITGEVYMPGEYEYVEGDMLADILYLAQGLKPGADLTGVNIYRYRENGTDFDIHMVDLKKQNAEDIPLQAFDRVIIAKDSELRRDWKITVEGNVKAPGEYLIGSDTTLYDILLLCGGPSSRGDLRNAIFANSNYMLGTDPEFQRLKMMGMTQMTTLEYHYMRNKLRQFPGKYSVEVAETWDSGGERGNPVLRDGDYLYVPEFMDMVEVSGQVVNPGFVPWVEGKDWSYYIEAAGGYTNNKRWQGTRIISFDSGNWLKPDKDVPINPGDTVFVAEKTDRDLWTDVKDVLIIVSELVTIFLGVRAITAN
jgi:protein involved in polysaccharide export with SLBB domain